MKEVPKVHSFDPLTLVVSVRDNCTPCDNQHKPFKKSRQADEDVLITTEEKQNTQTKKSDTNSEICSAERLKRKRHLHDTDSHCLNKINEKSKSPTTATCDFNEMVQSNLNQENFDLEVKLSTLCNNSGLQPDFQDGLKSSKQNRCCPTCTLWKVVIYVDLNELLTLPVVAGGLCQFEKRRPQNFPMLEQYTMYFGISRQHLRCFVSSVTLLQRFPAGIVLKQSQDFPNTKEKTRKYLGEL